MKKRHWPVHRPVGAEVVAQLHLVARLRVRGLDAPSRGRSPRHRPRWRRWCGSGALAARRAPAPARLRGRRARAPAAPSGCGPACSSRQPARATHHQKQSNQTHRGAETTPSDLGRSRKKAGIISGYLAAAPSVLWPSPPCASTSSGTRRPPRSTSPTGWSRWAAAPTDGICIEGLPHAPADAAARGPAAERHGPALGARRRRAVPGAGGAAVDRRRRPQAAQRRGDPPGGRPAEARLAQAGGHGLRRAGAALGRAGAARHPRGHLHLRHRARPGPGLPHSLRGERHRPGRRRGDPHSGSGGEPAARARGAAGPRATRCSSSPRR